jgi:putative peptidoglycan lipid II flippase
MPTQRESVHNESFRTGGLSTQTWMSATLILISCTIISKFFGFFREILIAKNFGVSAEVDAYMVSLMLPALIGSGIGSTFGISLIPLYHKILTNKGIVEANKQIRTVFTVSSIISIVFVSLLYFMPKLIIKTIAPSLPPSTSELAVELIRWLSVMILGLSLFYLSSSIYNALHHFKIPAFTDLASNICVILFLILFSSLWGIYSLIFGLLISTVLVTAIQICLLFKKGILGFSLDFGGSGLKGYIILAIPILFCDYFYQVGGIIENFFASGLAVGSIAALGYAKKLSISVVTLVAINIARAVFPKLSLLASEEKLNEARDLISKLMKQLIVYFLPVSILSIFVREEIIKIIFMRGVFDDIAFKITAHVFIFYIAGLTASIILPIFFRLSFAFSDGVTPLKATVIGILFMVVFNYFLTPVLGISGIALSSTVAVLLALFVMGMSVHKKLGGLDTRGILKVSFLSFLCALVSLLPISEFRMSNIYIFILSIIVYFMVYFVLGRFFMKDETIVLWRLYKKVWRGMLNHAVIFPRKSE